jgi:hypothetical protein
MMQLCQQCLALTSTLINVNTHDPRDSVALAVASMLGCHQFLALTSTLSNGLSDSVVLLLQQYKDANNVWH